MCHICTIYKYSIYEIIANKCIFYCPFIDVPRKSFRKINYLAQTRMIIIILTNKMREIIVFKSENELTLEKDKPAYEQVNIRDGFREGRLVPFGLACIVNAYTVAFNMYHSKSFLVLGPTPSFHNP